MKIHGSGADDAIRAHIKSLIDERGPMTAKQIDDERGDFHAGRYMLVLSRMVTHGGGLKVVHRDGEIPTYARAS